MMIIITLKIFKKIDDDNNYIKNIQRDRSVEIITLKISKKIGGNT